MSYYRPTTGEIKESYATNPEGVSQRAWDEVIAHAELRRRDEFDRWLQNVKAEAWNEALTHVERLSDPASTIDIYPERELITLADVTQAREENPYTKESNK